MNLCHQPFASFPPISCFQEEKKIKGLKNVVKVETIGDTVTGIVLVCACVGDWMWVIGGWLTGGIEERLVVGEVVSNMVDDL